MTTKERLHQLIEELPEEELAAFERLLTEPELRGLLLAPEGEPPLNAEEIAGILEAKRDKAAGRVYRFQNVEDAIAWLHQGPAPEEKP